MLIAVPLAHLTKGLEAGGAAVIPHVSHSNSKSKRKLDDAFPNGDNDDDEDDVSHTRPRSNTFKRDEDRLLACPFCKWKPLDYRSYYKYVLKEIFSIRTAFLAMSQDPDPLSDLLGRI